MNAIMFVFVALPLFGQAARLRGDGGTFFDKYDLMKFILYLGV